MKRQALSEGEEKHDPQELQEVGEEDKCDERGEEQKEETSCMISLHLF